MTPAGFPHSDIFGSTPACDSPKLFAANHVLHRLATPRHSPCALSSLATKSFVFLAEASLTQSSAVIATTFSRHAVYKVENKALRTSSVSVVSYRRLMLSRSRFPDTRFRVVIYY